MLLENHIEQMVMLIKVHMSQTFDSVSSLADNKDRNHVDRWLEYSNQFFYDLYQDIRV